MENIIRENSTTHSNDHKEPIATYITCGRQKQTNNNNNNKSTPGVKMLGPFTSYFWFLDYSEMSKVHMFQTETNPHSMEANQAR